MRFLKDVVSFVWPGVYAGERHNCLQGARRLRDALDARGVKSEVRLKVGLKGFHAYVALPQGARADYGIRKSDPVRRLRFKRRPDNWDADRFIAI